MIVYQIDSCSSKLWRQELRGVCAGRPVLTCAAVAPLVPALIGKLVSGKLQQPYGGGEQGKLDTVQPTGSLGDRGIALLWARGLLPHLVLRSSGLPVTCLCCARAWKRPSTPRRPLRPALSLPGSMLPKSEVV